MSPRERVSYGLKMALSHVLYYSGVFHLLCRTLLRRRVVVLMYHRVLTPAERRRTASQDGLIVEDKTFARQMAVLKRLFTVLTLEEFRDRMEQRIPFDGPCCLITFDDGWIDNYTNALPVLREERLPAVVFLPVSFIGTGRPLTREALTHLIVRAIEVSRTDQAARDRLRAHLAPLGLDTVLDGDQDDPLAAARRAVAVHRHASGLAFESLVATLCRELGIADGELSKLDTFIDWTQVEQMGRDGVAFGGHGAEHRVLTEVTPAVARFEVDTSKGVLEARLGTAARAFAYPNGEWDPAIAETVREIGYHLAFTVERGAVSCEDDPFTLKRVTIHEGVTRSTPMFLARLTGMF